MCGELIGEPGPLLKHRNTSKHQATEAPAHPDSGETEDNGWLQANVPLAAATTLTACGGEGSASNAASAPATSTAPPAAMIQPDSDEKAARFLLHASLSASREEIAELRTKGYESWFEAEVSKPIELSAKQFFASRGFDRIDNNNHFNRSAPADHMIWNQLVSGGNVLRKRVSLALSEFFVVSLKGLAIRWPAMAIGAYWDVLSDNAFGNFRDLLEAITRNPAMAMYLDTIGNSRADAISGRAPDENYAREIMQLFSIGLVELEVDGSPRMVGGRPIETFNQEDVSGLAKCFTGFHFDYSKASISSYPNNPSWPLPTPEFLSTPITSDRTRWWSTTPLEFYPDTQEKRFLRTVVPAGIGPDESLRIALDTLFEHSNVGPFFAKQMIQRLVTSNPSPAYVRRVAEVFNSNGDGMRGDLRAVFKQVLLDEEAIAAAGLTDASFGKLREPILRFAQWGRTFGATSQSGNWEIDTLERDYDQLAQSPLRSPSVFNFFRPTFVLAGSQVDQAGLVGPEFQLVNETSVTAYVNFMQLIIDGRSYQSRDVEAVYSRELEIAHDAQALLDHLNLCLTGNQLSRATQDTILEALRAISPAEEETAKLQRVKVAVFLVMVSADYAVQK